jgi:hypothetical protein
MFNFSPHAAPKASLAENPSSRDFGIFKSNIRAGFGTTKAGGAGQTSGQWRRRYKKDFVFKASGRLAGESTQGIKNKTCAATGALTQPL